jgi:kexin
VQLCTPLRLGTMTTSTVTRPLASPPRSTRRDSTRPLNSAAATAARVGAWAIGAAWLVGTASVPTAHAGKLQPAKRSYDTHVYYVLELDEAHPHAADWSPDEIAQVLGAEHVEQVGELKGHYLIRAEAGQVQLGEEGWATAAPVAPDQSRVRPRSFAGLQDGQRDKVLERYDLLRRRSLALASHSHSKRASSSAPHPRLIRSLERQEPRMRVKRDLPVLAPPDLSSFRRRLPRQGAAMSSAVEGLIAAAADKFSIFDPLWSKQWHLVNEVLPENSINVTGVWEQGYVGKGVNVAIVDDGLDMHSDDLAANFVSLSLTPLSVSALD